MANFGKLLLTNVGLLEQNNAQAGNPLKFKRIAMGSGSYSGNILTLTKLVKEEVSLDITRGYIKNSSYTVEGFFSNENLQIGFAWREIGLFVEDSNGNEVLYCYANAGDTYDYIPATEDERYTKNIRITTVIGNATNVSIVESEGVIYVDTVTFDAAVKEFRTDISQLWPSKSVSGSCLLAKDSAELPFVGMNLYGKSTQIKTNGYQLFDAGKLSAFSSSGATVKNNGDGSFTITGSGSLTDICGKSHSYTHEETVALIKKVGTLRFINNEISVPYLYISLWRGGAAIAEATNRYNKTASIQITEDMLNDDTFTMRIGFYGFAGDAITARTIRPMLYMDGDGTWEPFSGGMPAPCPEYPQEIVNVGDSGSVGVDVHSGNLIPYPYNGLTNNSSNEVTWTINKDRSVSVSGTPTAQRYFTVVLQYKLQKGIYTLSGCPSGGAYQKYWMYIERKSDGYVWYEVGNGATFEVTEEGIYDIAANVGASAGTISNLTFRPMLNYGEKALAYESYIKQSFAISTPNGLAGIPVSSGGNYTDENGQQWICDEVDLENGKYIKRIGSAIIDGSKPFTKNNGTENDNNFVYFTNKSNYGIDTSRYEGYCSHFQCVNSPSLGGMCLYMNGYSHVLYLDAKLFLNNDSSLNTADNLMSALAENPVKVRYILTTPIETALSDAEIAAYEALHSNITTTTIFNDAGAGMNVHYITKAHDPVFKKVFDKIDESFDKTNKLEESFDSRLEALDKRITNAWGAGGVWFRTEGSYKSKKSSIGVGTGVLPMAEIAIIGGTATEVISRTLNLVHAFERTSYHPNFNDHRFGWRADGKLFVGGFNWSGADKLFSCKLSAGTYRYICKTISEPEEGYYSIDLYTGENTTSLENKIALDSSNKFTLTEETTVYIGVHTTKGISGSEGVFSLFLQKTPVEYAIIDSYKIPEEITSLEVWGNPTTFLDLKEGILYYGRESISSTEKGEAMDVRDIIGYDDYIIKVIPESYSSLLLESASDTVFAVTFTLSDGGGTI